MVVGLGVLALVASRLDLERTWAAIADPRWPWLVMVLLFHLAVKPVRTLRWQQILRANGVDRGFGDLLRLVLIGLFFSAFLPTGLGGDVVRGYLTTDPKKGRLVSYLVVAVERLLGMATLAAVATAASLAALAADVSILPERVLVAVALTGAAFTIGGLGVFGLRAWRRHLRPLPLVGPRLERLEEALDLFHRRQAPRASILLSSFALQFLAILIFVACARAVGMDTPALVFFLVVPASVLAALLPVSVNGLGVREGVLVALLTAAGASPERAGAAALLALLFNTAFALLGGLLFVFHRRRKPVT